MQREAVARSTQRALHQRLPAPIAPDSTIALAECGAAFDRRGGETGQQLVADTVAACRRGIRVHPLPRLAQCTQHPIADPLHQLLHVTVAHVLLRRRFAHLQAAPGEFTWFDLPAGEVTFVCHIAGTRQELRHDTSKPVAELRVPRTALVHCERPANLPPRDGVRRRIAVAVRLDAQAEPMDLEFDDATGDAPQRLLPGRHRCELAAMWWDAEQQRTERARLGPNTTVELRAGDVQRIRFP